MRTANTTRTATIESPNGFRNVALFLVAPFIGLVYAVLLPFVGIATLLWTAGNALAATGALGRAAHGLKNVALLLAAPFIGLIYAVSFPFVGMAMLLWVAVEALAAKLIEWEVFALPKLVTRFHAA